MHEILAGDCIHTMFERRHEGIAGVGLDQWNLWRDVSIVISLRFSVNWCFNVSLLTASHFFLWIFLNPIEEANELTTSEKENHIFRSSPH